MRVRLRSFPFVLWCFFCCAAGKLFPYVAATNYPALQ